ncbi:MAG: PilW family protein [Proteobacteria bacterium]|nr:PilW family protein [Pseudomonadota bacterium]
MTRTPHHPHQRGFTLVEMLVALAVGVILVGAVIAVYIAQSQTYKSSNTQAAIQNAENAIGALVTPVVRSAGFGGCATLSGATSTLAPGVPPPLGAIATAGTVLVGYDAAGTAGGTGSSLAIAVPGTPNDPDTSHWTPVLDDSLAGQVAPGSDVLVVLGAVPGALPVAATAMVDGSSNQLVLANTSGFAAGQAVALSDCAKTSVFAASTVGAQVLTHLVSGGPIANAVETLGVDYAPGAQAVPLQQTAYFVAQDARGGPGSLVRATYGTGSTPGWNVQSLVPGIDTMQVLYGIGSAGTPAQYVSAGAVTDWGTVYSVRLGFLIEGDAGSAGLGSAVSFNVLGTAVTAPSDTRQRRYFEMTVGLRNAAP